MQIKKKYLAYRQVEEKDCGPTCLRMIASYHGTKYTSRYLKNLFNISRFGVSIGDIIEVANKIGIDSIAIKTTLSYLQRERPFPCILHWRQNHFVVLFNITKKNKYIVSDPAFGLLKLSEVQFNQYWSQKDGKGVALFLQLKADFHKLNGLLYKSTFKEENSYVIQFLHEYFKEHRVNLIVLFIMLSLGATTSVLFSSTMKRLFDKGITPRNFHEIYLVLLFQLFLFLGNIIMEWLRRSLLIKISLQLSFKIVKSILYKLIKLPISFFDVKTNDDIFQRIEDHLRIQNFLTQRFSQSIFSLCLLLILSIQLFLFNTHVFLVFSSLTIISVLWILIFNKKSRVLNYSRFDIATENRNAVVELIDGMEEIKINNAQASRITIWENIQKKLYYVELTASKLSQNQYAGLNGITQIKSIIITFICASAVVYNSMSLGVMLSISYIVGLLNNPIEQLTEFIISGRDAKMSMERIQELHYVDDEVTPVNNYQFSSTKEGLLLEKIFFKYPGASNLNVLENINLKIPKSKITAIVGSSGSGKTTLMKMLLMFYNPNEGNLIVDKVNSTNIDANKWRNQCGVVMQDGYIFSDSIAKNIALADETPNTILMINAAKIACIDDYVDTLPLGYNTKIGRSGLKLSGGQKQRILIARAVYKNPEYMFFDEATSSLDANNESKIIKNLNDFFVGRTVVIIAHRLSTVKAADQIIVLNEGQIVELGNHDFLKQKKGYYYNLIKNQLELEN